MVENTNHPGSLDLTIRFIAVLIGVGHLYAAWDPSLSNWGFHHLGFLDPSLRYIIPLCMIAVAIPGIDRAGVRAVRCALGRWLRAARSIRAVSIISGVLLFIAACWFFRSAGVMGDGLWLVNWFPTIRKMTDTAHVYTHEPLTGLIQWLTAQMLSGEPTPQHAEISYRIISIASGAGFCLFLLKLVPVMTERLEERFFAYFLILASASTEVFFGYIENYSIAFLFCLIFIVYSLKYLNAGVPLIVPSLLMAVLIPLYFGLMVFLPALGYLYYRELRRVGKIIPLAVNALASLVLMFVLLSLTGYSPVSFFQMLVGGGKHLIALREIPGETYGYTLFSFPHLTDLGNLPLLIAPFSLFMIGVALLFQKRRAGWIESRNIFLTLMAIGGSAVSVLFMCELGMTRDWDLLAPFYLPVIIISIRFFNGLSFSRIRRAGLYVIILVVTILHTIPWIVLNHESTPAEKQFRMVLEETTWIEDIHVGYEGLAMAAKRRGDYEDAASIYRLYLARDSVHPRIVGNLADVYRILGRTDLEMYYTEKAVRLHTNVPVLYFNLGIMYGRRGRYQEAIRVMEEGLRRDSLRPDILNAIGSFMLLGSDSCSAALPYFERALRIDPSYALANLNAGVCYDRLGEKSLARYHLLRYLELEPSARNAGTVLEMLKDTTGH